MSWQISESLKVWEKKGDEEERKQTGKLFQSNPSSLLGVCVCVYV